MGGLQFRHILVDNGVLPVRMGFQNITHTDVHNLRFFLPKKLIRIELGELQVSSVSDEISKVVVEQLDSFWNRNFFKHYSVFYAWVRFGEEEITG